MDSAGNLYIADSSNNRIREVNLSTGLITTVAGNGNPQLRRRRRPGHRGRTCTIRTGVAVDAAGDLYIADNEQQPHPRGQLLHRRDHHRGRQRNRRLRRRQWPATAADVQFPGRRRRGRRRRSVHRRHQSTTASARSTSPQVSSPPSPATATAGFSRRRRPGQPPPSSTVSSRRWHRATGDLFIADTRQQPHPRGRRLAGGGVPVTVNPASRRSTTIAFASPPAATYGGSVSLSATLLCGGVAMAGETVLFTLNGSPWASGVTNAAGVAAVSAVAWPDTSRARIPATWAPALPATLFWRLRRHGQFDGHPSAADDRGQQASARCTARPTRPFPRPIKALRRAKARPISAARWSLPPTSRRAATPRPAVTPLRPPV